MSDLMYRLVLRAKFESQEELQRAVQGLEQLQWQGSKVSVSVGEMGRQSATSLQSIARSGMSVMFMFNMLESAYMRQQMAMLMLENSQERYNKTVEKYGENSEEARQAAKELEMQQNYLNMANMRSNVSLGLMITNLALQSNLLEKTTLTTIARTAATALATAADWAHVAALKIKNILMAAASFGTSIPFQLGAAAAVGVGLGALTAYTIASAPPPSKGNITINTDVNVETSVDDALREQNRQVTNELKRISG